MNNPLHNSQKTLKSEVLLQEVGTDNWRWPCGVSSLHFVNLTRWQRPFYRLQWWSCPGATQWGTPFSKEGLSELALVEDSRNPGVHRNATVLINMNDILVSHQCVCVCLVESENLKSQSQNQFAGWILGCNTRSDRQAIKWCILCSAGF